MKLFVEEAGLSWCWCGRFAAGDADYAEDGEFGKGGARDEDAVGGGVKIGRRDLQAVVEEREEVVRDYAFERVAVGVAQADPQAVELGAAEEDFAFGLEIVREFADEIDGADARERKFLVLAFEGEEIDRIGLAQA
jgi:hypothetical protein